MMAEIKLSSWNYLPESTASEGKKQTYREIGIDIIKNRENKEQRR